MALPLVATDLHPDQERKHRTIISQALNECIKVRPPNDQTESEITAGITPLDIRYPPGDVRRYGAKGDGVTDDTAAVQAAVNVGLIANHAIFVAGVCRLGSSVNIDRVVDGAAYDNYFRIVGIDGGGFYATSAINMFSTTFAFTTAPVTQLVRFEGVTFEASSTAFDAYVLDDAKFLRTSFQGCNFVKIKCLTALTVYTQSIYFSDCNVRRVTGVWFNSAGSASFDIQFHNMLIEASADAIRLKLAVGCAFTHHTSEGSASNTAIKIDGSQGLYIQGYFEGNQRDIDLTGGSHLGAIIAGSIFNGTTGGAEAVYWGIAENCISIGNYCNSKLHNLSSTSKVAIRDYAVSNITNRDGQSEIPYNVPMFDANISADSAAVTSSTFVKAQPNTEVIDTNGNYDNSTNYRFLPTVPGYYEFVGKLNALAVGGTNTRAIVSIFKNGSEAFRLADQQFSVAAGGSYILGGSCIVLMNGTTDYVEMFGFITGGGTPKFGFGSTPEATRFSGTFLRSVGI